MPRNFVIVIGIALCFNLMSCDLFKTRTPEEPSQQSSNYVPPTEPSLVLQNMVSEFQGGDAVHYKNSFSDAFSFTPSTSAQGKYGIEWTAWNSTQEQTYFKNLFVHFNNASIILTFESISPIQINSTTYQVETTYSLTLPTETGIIKRFNGQVQFTLVQDPSGSWSINRWVDVGSDSTWSDLKGIAYSQW
jgi:hypothetical protein